jgi:hypothetical protein
LHTTSATWSPPQRTTKLGACPATTRFSIQRANRSVRRRVTALIGLVQRVWRRCSSLSRTQALLLQLALDGHAFDARVHFGEPASPRDPPSRAGDDLQDVRIRRRTVS